MHKSQQKQRKEKREEEQRRKELEKEWEGLLAPIDIKKFIRNPDPKKYYKGRKWK